MSITIAGNVGGDPVYDDAGATPRLSFRVAVNTWDKTHGEQTQWFGVTVWGQYANSLNTSGRIRKGAPVAVSGQLTVRTYQDKNNEKVTSLEIRPDSVQSFAPKTDNALPFGEAPF